MKLIPALLIACFFTVFGALTATAQLSSFALKAPWLQSFFAKMSPDTPEFTAIGQMDMCDASGAVRFELPMNVSASRNCFRWDADVSKVRPLPPRVIMMAKMMRTDKQIFLVKKDGSNVCIIYPNLHAYVQIPIPPPALAEFDARSAATQIRKIEAGQETVDGHPCIKNKVFDVDPNIPPQPGLMWNASDLRGFPIKIELETDRGLMKFHFQKVVVQPSNSSLFNIPRDYMLFTNSGALMNYAKNQL
ncbi:MAG: hypothetical protein ACREFR_12130 [Limisphaerales bacterium]